MNDQAGQTAALQERENQLKARLASAELAAEKVAGPLRASLKEANVTIETLEVYKIVSSFT